jgi:hypothetical protein
MEPHTDQEVGKNKRKSPQLIYKILGFNLISSLEHTKRNIGRTRKPTTHAKVLTTNLMQETSSNRLQQPPG